MLAALREVDAKPLAIVRGSKHRMLDTDVYVVDDLVAADPAAMLAGCHAVVNCAARVHVLHKEDKNVAARAYNEMNAVLPVKLAQGARKSGVKRFVQLSSVAAHTSSSLPGRTVADGAAEEPTGPYGEAKLAGDRALAAISSPAMPIISLRPPALYGPGVGAFFAMLLRAARLGLPLPLGRYDNRRSFAFVDNVADAVVTALASPTEGSYIVTDSAPLSTARLYSQLLSLYGYGDRVLNIPKFLVNPIVRLSLRERARSLVGDAAYDGSRFQRDLGWTPRWTMAEGLARTVAAT